MTTLHKDKFVKDAEKIIIRGIKENKREVVIADEIWEYLIMKKIKIIN